MELLRALAALAEPPASVPTGLGDLLDLPGRPTDAAWADLFLTQLYPYGSVYLGPEGMLGGDARDRVAGFFRAMNVTPPAEPDHLTVLLSTYATLAEHEAGADDESAAAAWRRARAALLWEHLLPWVPGYLDRVAEVAADPYRAWAALLRDALRREVEVVGKPRDLPLHVRAAPGLPDPRTGDPQGLLAGLLAPARTGMIVLRDDLARACRDLDLGLRIGERRFVLRAMLDQDPAATLHWLAGHARQASDRHDRTAWSGPSGVAWAARAAATANLLDKLADEAAAEARAGDPVPAARRP